MIYFTGPGTPMSSSGFANALGGVGAAAEALWAVLSVETSGCGYLSDRRPKILFERHIFHRLTNGKYDEQDPDVSAPTAGGYGLSGSHQYIRLEAAMQLDEEAALMSASWGLGQILGTNFKLAGFSDVTSMVEAFVGSEDSQLAGMANFIRGGRLAASLAQKNWKDFARLYNGANYAAHDYDGHLQLFYGIYDDRGCPEIDLRAAQIFLIYLGFDVGGVDGLQGPKTTAALSKFQGDAGVAVTGLPDTETLDALRVRVAAL